MQTLETITGEGNQRISALYSMSDTGDIEFHAILLGTTDIHDALHFSQLDKIADECGQAYAKSAQSHNDDLEIDLRAEA